MIVLDTHAWIWWVSNPDLLSKHAAQVLSKAVREKSILVSSISAWEVAMLVKKGRLKLSMPPEEWIARSERLSFLNFVPVDNSVLLKSVNLSEKFSQDPADRIIVATALLQGAKLVSKDASIRKAKVVDVVW
ncbi:MAG: type II toxin-antitoxin system VapC family toxin [Leptospirales bacterium]|nr:type II toxin-antitoxin system VapC family toxin [Leptospirales bacterium]